jgi:hypothetical protein
MQNSMQNSHWTEDYKFEEKSPIKQQEKNAYE